MEIKYLAVGPYGTNCYFLCDKEAGVCAVIDPGGSPDQILAVLEKLACRPCAILLTHGHYDHTGAVADLLERFPGIRVSIHRGDFQNVDTKLRCGSALFCGDTLFAGSCGRTDFDGGSVEKMMASLKRLGQLEGDLDVLPGHMELSTLDRERASNPYLRHALEIS